MLLISDKKACLEERKSALKTRYIVRKKQVPYFTQFFLCLLSNETGISIFIPSCQTDGSYSEVQCHDGTGYCWCADREGKPIHGSSVKFESPKCKTGKG